MNLKEEIKKSATSEIVRTVIRLALFLALMLGAALIPPIRDRIWPATPKWLLLGLLVISLSVILGLVPYAMHLRRKNRTLQSELENLKSKPTYPYKFGVKWDKELNPRCPHCEAHLTGYQYIRLSTMPDVSRFNCGGCGRIILMADEAAKPIHFKNAKALIEGRINDVMKIPPM